jgi:hypothetical protein
MHSLAATKIGSPTAERNEDMKRPTAVAAPEDRSDPDAWMVHAWRVTQLARLGLARPVAEAVADEVDWHEVAKLVRRGCPADLAVMIVH